MAQRTDQELVSWEIIGAELGMTGEGARKIYNQALTKIREYFKDNPERSAAALNLLIDCESRHYRNTIKIDVDYEGCSAIE